MWVRQACSEDPVRSSVADSRQSRARADEHEVTWRKSALKTLKENAAFWLSVLVRIPGDGRARPVDDRHPVRADVSQRQMVEGASASPRTSMSAITSKPLSGSTMKASAPVPPVMVSLHPASIMS